MEKAQIVRLNLLAKKSKAEGLTEDERLEQKALRAEYLLGVRSNLRQQLENTYLVDEQGNEVKLQPKTKH